MDTLVADVSGHWDLIFSPFSFFLLRPLPWLGTLGGVTAVRRAGRIRPHQLSFFRVTYIVGDYLFDSTYDLITISNNTEMAVRGHQKKIEHQKILLEKAVRKVVLFLDIYLTGESCALVFLASHVLLWSCSSWVAFFGACLAFMGLGFGFGGYFLHGETGVVHVLVFADGLGWFSCWVEEELGRVL